MLGTKFIQRGIRNSARRKIPGMLLAVLCNTHDATPTPLSLSEAAQVFAYNYLHEQVEVQWLLQPLSPYRPG